jgi:hypothetical protein
MYRAGPRGGGVFEVHFMTTLDERRVIRRAAGADPHVPVRVVEGDMPLVLRGHRCHWTTKGGSHICHPNAYSAKGWSNMVYHHSTRRVEVGREWMARTRRPKVTIRVVGRSTLPAECVVAA